MRIETVLARPRLGRKGNHRERGRDARSNDGGPAAGCPFPASGRGGQGARAPRKAPTRSGFPWERGRPARKWAEGSPVCSSGQDARAPRDRRGPAECCGGDARSSGGGPAAGCPFPASGRGGQGARAPRKAPTRSGFPWERGRPARKWAEGPPVCSSGQDARAPRDRRGPAERCGGDARSSGGGPAAGCSFPASGRGGQGARAPRKAPTRSGFPWERGRPARKWAEGPPVCSSGQDAALPGTDAGLRNAAGETLAQAAVGLRRVVHFRPPAGAGRAPALQGKHPRGAGFPGSAGVPPASGPKAHPCAQAGKMPALPGTDAGLRNAAGETLAQAAVGLRRVVHFRPPAGAGRAPALQGKHPRGAGFPGSAGVPPASGPKAHPCAQAGKMPALPGTDAGLRNAAGETLAQAAVGLRRVVHFRPPAGPGGTPALPRAPRTTPAAAV